MTPDDGLKIIYIGTSPRADVVAVHGFGGHRGKAWTADDGTNWLQSLLPADLPNSRILIWGYNASLGPNREQQSLQNISHKLVLDLYKMRELTKVSTNIGVTLLVHYYRVINNMQTQTRPIIFIAHSLGGSSVKSALVFSDLQQENDSSHLDIISASTCGVVFMDTTELGISTNGMEKVLQSIAGSDQENSESFKEAKWLLATLNRYVSLSAKLGNVYVSPQVRSRGNSEIGNGGKRPCPSPRIRLKFSFNQDSSSQLNSSYIVIDADHNTINKFKSPEDTGYLKIKAELLDILRISSSSPRQISWEK